MTSDEARSPDEEPQAPLPPRRPLRRMVIGILCFLAACTCVVMFILAPIFQQAGLSVQTKLCAANLSKVARAMILYAQDNDDCLPMGRNWMDALSTIEPDPLLYACPVQRRIDPESYGYAFNKELEGKQLHALTQPDMKVLVFDSSATTRNAVAPPTALAVPGRHRNGRENNVVYADGRVKQVDLDN